MRHTAEDVLVAGLRLRFGVEVVEADVYVPPNAVGPVAVVLLLADDATSDNVDRLAPGLCAGADLWLCASQPGHRSWQRSTG